MDPRNATAQLHGTQVLLRLMTHEDVDAVTAILAEPAVSRWWGRYDAERVRAEMLDDRDGAVVYVIEHDGAIVGSIQYHEERNPDYRHAGMDVFLSAAHHGRGLATDAVRTLARHLVHDRGHHRLVIDPAADNAAAIRLYERIGFRPVGVMRAYERGPDGTFHDGLLMDLLKAELH